MLPTNNLTIFQQYQTNRTQSTYWSKLKSAFRSVNGNGPYAEYKIAKTNGNFVIQRQGVTIFVAEKRAYSIRNVYLELHSCNYNVELWFVRSSQGEFNNES